MKIFMISCLAFLVSCTKNQSLQSAYESQINVEIHAAAGKLSDYSFTSIKIFTLPSGEFPASRSLFESGEGASSSEFQKLQIDKLNFNIAALPGTMQRYYFAAELYDGNKLVAGTKFGNEDDSCRPRFRVATADGGKVQLILCKFSDP